MYGSPFPWPCWYPALLGPGPNFSEESAIEPCAAKVMQQTSDLILADLLGSMAQGCSHRRAHAGRPHRMGTIVSANGPARVNRVRVIVETHQPGHERAGNQERGTS